MIYLSAHANFWLNTLIPAVIAIVSCSLAVFPGASTYYEVPMGIIGKVYVNSMLVLLNSRMVLGSEETKKGSTVISVMKFSRALGNPTDNRHHCRDG